MAGEHELDDHRDELIVIESVAALLGVDHRGQEVVARVSAPLLDLFSDVLVECRHCRVAGRSVLVAR